MGFFGSNAGIRDANSADKAETADALRKEAVFELARGNYNKATRLDDQARALEK